MAELALDFVIWGAALVLVLAVVLVGALAAAERPRPRRDGIADILRETAKRRKR
ncbi:hypothetical protein ABID82_000664 [Methylobacterium sp. PvP062]|jgi:hypothetical protein|uniref:Uncharacterized protein n=1 Tax=Methylobacterium radiotolerans TaxID=31998 RepID=A0ABV2NI23_9HYPH|nr:MULTISPECIES: hypothetical protein [Methylobacterium]MCX7333972.1 hypothetical protein [Hyphomicrobiales bacterium]MCY4506402.1 hypothetical protein [Acidobacteriota bacterium]GAN51684.1 putative NADH dehydrogenase subunit J [Methylobacterium sp. ME121]KZB97337.1 hypothetical protein AU375_06531 [Methylobacterium radiotolerans]MBN6820078.1 hypothetical protein [Methylobacterium organophilum]